MANAQNSSTKVRVTATLEGDHADRFNARLAAEPGRSAAWVATLLIQQALAATQSTASAPEADRPAHSDAPAQSAAPAPAQPELPVAPAPASTPTRTSRRTITAGIVLALALLGLAVGIASRPSQSDLAAVAHTLHTLHTRTDQVLAKATEIDAQNGPIVDILSKNRLEISQLRGRVEQLEKQAAQPQPAASPVQPHASQQATAPRND